MSSESADRQIAALHERLACLRQEARQLLERFKRREISPTEARAEVKRLEQEVLQGERQVEELEKERPSNN